MNRFKNKNKYFFIFAPDYNKIDTKKTNSILSTYKIIPYSKIFKFYDKYRDTFGNKTSILYYLEFLYAIQKHSNDVDNVLEIDTHKKFIKKILIADS